MSILIALLQIVVVGLGSAAVLAFLLSNFRYRKLELLAEEEAESRAQISPSALVIQLLADVRKEKVLLCRVQTPSATDNLKIRKLLDGTCRETDVHSAVENGVTLSRFLCLPDKAAGLGNRVMGLLKEHGFTEGSVLIWQPELDTEALLTWILCGDNHEPTGPLRLAVQVPPESEEEPAESGGSSAIDPVTGVFREDRVSRAIRRKLAEQNRRRQEVTMMRVFLHAPEEENERNCIMKQSADLLMQGCRESDLIGRSGPAEFVLCLEGPAGKMEGAARRMHRVLADAGLPGSFGLASMPEHGDNPGQLFDRAGLAVEKSSDKAHDSVTWFDTTMERSQESDGRETFVKEEF